MRKIFMIMMLGWAGQAMASITFQSFTWRADSRFELTLGRDSGTPLVFKGELRDDDKVQVVQNKLTVDIKHYKTNGPFVTIAVTAESQDLGVLFILAQQNSVYVALNNAPIVGRRASLLSDLDGIITSLSKESADRTRPAWTIANIFEKIKTYFTDNPTKQLTDFYDDVELNKIKELPRPQPQGVAGANGRGSVRTPQFPPGMRPPQPGDDDQQYSPDDFEAQRQAELQQQQQQRRRRQQQMQQQQMPQPWSPFGPPRGYPQPPQPPGFNRGPFNWFQN